MNLEIKFSSGSDNRFWHSEIRKFWHPFGTFQNLSGVQSKSPLCQTTNENCRTYLFYYCSFGTQPRASWFLIFFYSPSSFICNGQQRRQAQGLEGPELWICSVRRTRKSVFLLFLSSSPPTIPPPSSLLPSPPLHARS